MKLLTNAIIASKEVEIIAITLNKPTPPLSTTPGKTCIINASNINKVNKTTKWADNFTSFSFVSIVPRINNRTPKKAGIRAVNELVSIYPQADIEISAIELIRLNFWMLPIFILWLFSF